MPRARNMIFQTLRLDTSTGRQDRLDSTPHGAISKLSFAEKKFVPKMTHQILPVGKLFTKLDPSQPIACSSYKLQPASATHLYRCPTFYTAMEAFLQDTLQSILQASHTCPQLAYTQLEALYSDHNDKSFPELSNRHGTNNPKKYQ